MVVFGDPGIGFARTLLESLLEASRRRSDIEVVAVCDAGRSGRTGEILRGCRRRAVRAFNPELREGAARTGSSLTAADGKSYTLHRCLILAVWLYHRFT